MRDFTKTTSEWPAFLNAEGRLLDDPNGKPFLKLSRGDFGRHMDGEIAYCLYMVQRFHEESEWYGNDKTPVHEYHSPTPQNPHPQNPDSDPSATPVQSTLDSDTALQFMQIVEKVLESREAPHVIQNVTVKLNLNGKTSQQVCENEHPLFGKLLSIMSTGLPVFLVGPAGAGKSTAVEHAAKAMGLEYSFKSVGEATSEMDLLGYFDAHGEYITTEFRKRYENGGVMLLDEMDSASASAMVVINAAVSNGMCAFPDGMIKKNAHFRLVSAGNTYGTGPDAQYVGRSRLDGATLDRFVYLRWPYAEEFEMNLAGNRAWTEKVLKLRKRADEIGLKVIISPRASLYGSKLLEAGLSEQEVTEMVVWRGMDSATRHKLEGVV